MAAERSASPAAEPARPQEFFFRSYVGGAAALTTQQVRLDDGHLNFFIEQHPKQFLLEILAAIMT
jgi:hypothetical protein